MALGRGRALRRKRKQLRKLAKEAEVRGDYDEAARLLWASSATSQELAEKYAASADRWMKISLCGLGIATVITIVGAIVG